MKRYPAYKDSGVAWLGEVPAHWTVTKLKWVATLQYGDSLAAQDRRDGNVPVYGSNGIVGTHDYAITQSPCIIVGRKGSFGKVNLSEVPCFPIDTAFFIDSTSTSHSLYWLAYLLPLLGLDELSKDSAVPGLNREDAYANLVPLPSLREQTAIAAYLDRKTAQIDAVIAKTERVLRLMQEMRMAITQDAMHSSSSQSLRLSVVTNNMTLPVHRQDDMVYTPIGLYNRGRGIFHKEPTLGSELGESDFFWIKEGDLVISGQFAWEGAVAIAQQFDSGCIASHRYHILRGTPGVLETPYLLSFLKTQYGDLILNDHSRGAAGRNRPLNISTFLKEKIPVPPMSVQRDIAELVHKEAHLKQETEKRVSLLREYRTALISAVVTGKMDVREEAVL